MPHLQDCIAQTCLFTQCWVFGPSIDKIQDRRVARCAHKSSTYLPDATRCPTNKQAFSSKHLYTTHMVMEALRQDGALSFNNVGTAVAGLLYVLERTCKCSRCL